MLVKRQTLPILDSLDAPIARDLFQLLFTGQIVTNVMEVHLPRCGRLRILDQQRDGDRRTAATSKNLSPFSTGSFSRSALIPPQVKHMHAGELLCQTAAHAVRRVRIQKPRIGHKANHPPVPDPVAGPANGTDVAVVQAL